MGPCGVFFPNGDVKALAHALKEVLTDAELSAKLVAGRT